jgi:hypothetical protein
MAPNSTPTSPSMATRRGTRPERYIRSPSSSPFPMGDEGGFDDAGRDEAESDASALALEDGKQDDRRADVRDVEAPSPLRPVQCQHP